MAASKPSPYSSKRFQQKAKVKAKQTQGRNRSQAAKRFR